MTLRRESVIVMDQQRKENTVQWQAMKAFIPTWNITYAMNTGAMNKSWIKEKSGLAEELRESDLRAIENLEAAGAKHITIYMQSPMSKGPAKTFVDGPDGASIETRIKDIKRYINWIKARRPDSDPIKLDYALIDAHPPKGIYPDPADYKDVYRRLAIALKKDNIPFVGIMIDWKATTINSEGAKELIDICRWVQTDLSKELGIDYYAGWWIWYYIKKIPHEELYERAKRGVKFVMSKPDNHWVRHVYVGAKLGEHAPLLPDTVDYKLPNGRLEGINETYEMMEPSSSKK